MKRVLKKVMLAAVCATMLCACDSFLSEKENVPEVTIDPVDIFFQFGDDGVPTVIENGWLQPRAERMRTVKEQLVGHGWKQIATYEISSKTGVVMHEDYFHNLIGASPTDYYFKSERELTTYFVHSGFNRYAYRDWDIEIDYESGAVRPLIVSPTKSVAGNRPILNIVAIAQEEGEWRMYAVELLATRSREDGTQEPVWGLTTFRQMGNKELVKMQKEFTFDITTIN